ncbi:hypothetical protein [Tardiphaga sp.]
MHQIIFSSSDAEGKSTGGTAKSGMIADARRSAPEGVNILDWI